MPDTLTPNRPLDTALRKIRVLVFPCGAENALEIHDALHRSVHVELFGASSVEDHGRFRFRNYDANLPRITDPAFDAAFAALLTRRQINVVFPTHDTVAEYLAPRAAGWGIHLVNGDPETARITRSKRATYALFQSHAWVPEIHEGAPTSYPVIVKPDRGQGGQHVIRADDADALADALRHVPDPLVVEYLPGDEITVDCFTDRYRRLTFAGARTRERVRAGISMRSAFLPLDPAVEAIAATINQELLLRGPWFFQLRRSTAGTWKLLEISCRIAGTMAAHRARGVNLPLMALHDVMGRDVRALPNMDVRLVERRIATVACFDHPYETIFVDLDDTLVIDGRAVPEVIAYLYAAIGRGVRVVLITRHAYDIAETLRRARIGQELFDDIIHLTDARPKSDFIRPGAILIDNYFPERRAAIEAGFPAFDVDAVPFLP